MGLELSRKAARAGVKAFMTPESIHASAAAGLCTLECYVEIRRSELGIFFDL
ncbi:hypothetical protein JCM12107_18510 [Corynebacterium simulans]